MATAIYQPLDAERGPSQYDQLNMVDPNMEYLQERDQSIKSRVRKLRILIRCLAFGCAYFPSSHEPSALGL